MKTIPIFFTFNRWYVMAAGIAFYSLLKHASPSYHYSLYVLHSDISIKGQLRLKKLVEKWNNAELNFIDTSSWDTDKRILSGKAHFSKEIFYKLIAAEVFPQYERIICSDVDVVFLGDISQSFFSFPNENFYVAGVGQILKSNRVQAYTPYFNEKEIHRLYYEIAAGYMLMNLSAIRQDGIQTVLTEYYKENYKRLLLPEQDCIALCCYPHIKYLPLPYLVLNSYFENQKSDLIFTEPPIYPEYSNNNINSVTHFKNAISNPIQLHYVGPNKPWNKWGVSKQKIWLKYAREAGFLGDFIIQFPIHYARTFRKYSIKRFLKKFARKNQLF